MLEMWNGGNKDLMSLHWNHQNLKKFKIIVFKNLFIAILVEEEEFNESDK